MIFLQLLLIYYLWKLGLRKVIVFFVLAELVNIVFILVRGGYLTINLVVEMVLSMILVICLGERALRLKKVEKRVELSEENLRQVLRKIF